MQSVNDEMDDLLRKAAEHYPLKTNSDNWDSVLNKMNGQQKPALNAPNNKYKKMLWLLMLIPFAWVCNNYLTSYDEVAGRDDKVSKPAKNQITKTSSAKADKTDTSIGKSMAVKEPIILNELKEIDKRSGTDKRGVTVQYKMPHKNIGEQPEAIVDLPATDDFITLTVPALFLQSPGLLPVNESVDKDALSAANHSVPVLDSTIQKLLSKLKKKQSNTRSFFITLLAGPDVSTIKFQKVTHTGFNIGTMAGYHFTSRFSLQTGLIYNKKTYYSKGQYFSTKNLNTPADYFIKTVDGNCKMYELPVVGSYRLSSKKNGLVINAGISSYLMKGENYDYFVVHNGYAYTKNASYKNHSVNFAAAAIGGITLRNKVSNNTTLNVEPYFKIPLRGVGIGRLPITSGGINLSLTRNLQ